MKSRVHPKYKTKYRVWNWPEYDRALVQRGDLTLWISADAIEAWKPEPSGRQGECATVKHGGKGKRGWKKLHLGVDGSGVIVTQVLTDGSTDDAAIALSLIEEVKGGVASLTAGAAYGTIAIYDAGGARGVKVIVPPTKTATRSRRRRPQSTARDRTIKRVRTMGRRRWKKESGYHRQAGVENAFFRYKSIIGDRLRARYPKAQKAEALIGCNILNGMTVLGRPASRAIGA